MCACRKYFRSNQIWLSGLVALLTVLLSVTAAYALSISQSFVSTGVYAGGETLQEVKGELPSSLNSSLSDYNELYAIKQSARASAATNLSRSARDDVFSAGSLSGSGYAAIENSWGGMESASGAAGIIDYFVQINPILPLPFTVSTVPVIFTAHGEITQKLSSSYGAATSTALSYVSTNLPGFDSYKNEFRAESEVTLVADEPLRTVTASFSATAHLLAVCNAEYHVQLYGTGWAGAWNHSEASFSFMTDPSFMFDQEAFDLLYGTKSFLLSNYFKFDFSSNMPLQEQSAVPEPSSVLLLCSGLIGTIYLRRRAR